jgi:hypothetical protein
MFIILPHDVDGISELEKKLAGFDLSKILTQLPEQEVEVSIPKFKLEETTDLNDILTEVCINGYMAPLNPLQLWQVTYNMGGDNCVLCYANSRAIW